jgi:hypothetical protein
MLKALHKYEYTKVFKELEEEENFISVNFNLYTANTKV